MNYSTSLFEQIVAEKAKIGEQKRIALLELVIPKLKEYFSTISVKSLYITGSLIVENRFRERSDIDIAVEGLSEDIYFKTIGDLEEIVDRKVEIIELENCRFAEKIRTTGLKLI